MYDYGCEKHYERPANQQPDAVDYETDDIAEMKERVATAMRRNGQVA